MVERSRHALTKNSGGSVSGAAISEIGLPYRDEARGLMHAAPHSRAPIGRWSSVYLQTSGSFMSSSPIAPACGSRAASAITSVQMRLPISRPPGVLFVLAEPAIPFAGQGAGLTLGQVVSFALLLGR